MKPDGVLAIHITNRFLDLRPVIKTAAESFGKEARLVTFEGDRDRLIFRSTWALVSAEPGFFQDEHLRNAATGIEDHPGFRVWRDDYSSVFSVLK